uniref:Uncharacterized protein n=1 Tax=Picea glauca TaxID=3330 RepID=A0A101M486_PICGL|nr:hypothetical protein ABT39_MTgene378 [Picea glauca]
MEWNGNITSITLITLLSLIIRKRKQLKTLRQVSGLLYRLRYRLRLVSGASTRRSLYGAGK